MRKIMHTVSAMIACSVIVLSVASPAAANSGSISGSTSGAGIQSIGGALECTVFPYLTYPPVYGESCVSSKPSYSTTIHFRVTQPSTGYSYSWSMVGATLPTSCTSTASTCSVTVSTRGHDREITATVVVSDGSQSASYTSWGYGIAACPGPTGVEYC